MPGPSNSAAHAGPWDCCSAGNGPFSHRCFQFQGIAKTTVLNDVNRIKARITGYAGQIESLTERLSELPSTVSATPIFKQMEKLEELKRQDEELLAKTKANQQRDKPMDVKSFTRILGQINATRKNLDDGWKAKIIEKLVHKVELFPNRLAIHFYVGQSLLQGESLSKEGGSPFFFSAEQKSSRKRKSLNQLRALHSNTAKPPVGSSNTIDYGEPGAIRTRDLQLRRLTLYPTELRALSGIERLAIETDLGRIVDAALAKSDIFSMPNRV